MKKFLNSLFFSKCTAILCMIGSAVSVLLNYAFRFGYVFIDNTLFNGFSFGLFIIALVNTVLLVAVSVLKMKGSDKCDKKGFKVLQVISELFAVIFFIVVIVNFIVSGRESSSVAIKLCEEILPMWLAVVGVTTALFIIPNISKKGIKKAVSVVMSVIMVFAVYSALFPTSVYKFTSSPVVFDNGDAYSVVFTTNDNGTAYVEYEYQGESIRVYDEDNGRKKASTIHTITVPYEQLSGNTYKVSSTRVIDELSYGGRSGKTIESESIAFNDNFGDNVNVLTVSDWHTHNKIAQETAAQLGEYNAVILLGDCAPGLMFTQEVEDYLISFAADLTGGEMPVLFARGNHETRGREAGNLSSYIGYDNFYYTTKLGNYNFIVLDSGEDKTDDHSEYGGMVVYEQNRQKMVDWLTTLENTEHSKTIAFSHDKGICIEEDLSQTAHNKLDELNVSLLVSGHYHSTEFFDESPYPVLVDGGINADGDGTYVASMLSISQDKIDVKSVNSDGETTISETVLWR